MLRGCWLLAWDWVGESQRAGAWLSEADFEVQVCWDPAQTVYELDQQTATHYTLIVY